MSAVVPRVVGVDPGTVSFDVCGLHGEELFLDESLATEDVAALPDLLLEVLRSAGPVDLVVGPSGYGAPWTTADELDDDALDLLLLGEPGLGRGTVIGGMGRALRALRGSGLPVRFAPGVVHLSTVPAHRKVNRIDMGTADKVCAVALAVWDQARGLDLAWARTSFIHLELGGAFTAVTAVEHGAIVDGSGGTSGPLGFRAAGALDGELAFLLGDFPKSCLASGGVAAIAGRPHAAPGELVAAAAGDPRAALAWDAFFEGLAKTVAAQTTVVPAPREVLLSGRLSRLAWVFERCRAAFGAVAPVRRVQGFATVAKEAAQGAALLAQGLAGGQCAGLVDAMGLCDVGGTVLDHLYMDGVDEVRSRYRVDATRPPVFSDRREDAC